MDTLCREGCYLEMARKRSLSQEREKMQFRRYRKTLEERKAQSEKCFYCDTPVEVLRHRDEDQSNNRDSNLLSLCKVHHLEQVHASDSESYRFENEAVQKSTLSWTSAKQKRLPDFGHLKASDKPVAHCPPLYLPWGTNKGGTLQVFWKTKWLHPYIIRKLTATGTCRLMLLLEKLGWKEIPKES